MRLIIGFFLVWLIVIETATADQSQRLNYVGRLVCTECHSSQNELWAGSHHDLAMQAANEKSVLGDFSNTRLEHFGVTSVFYKSDDKFMVRTEGSDGELHDYPIKYTFGAEPLQQYLIEFPGGRLQALNLAWDSRPEAKGGQRWFPLNPNEKITHDDELHWTGHNQNWNSMCAECHSTDLKKNYDSENKTYATTWTEIDVSCEACHGPGQNHVMWAGKMPGQKINDGSKGLHIDLDERKNVRWKINPVTGNAMRSMARHSDKEIEMCARCHSLRSPISKSYIHGESLLNHYRPELLNEGAYFADGQINGEVYVYGSFIQSKMYHAGVTCSDCHEPHSLELKAPGNLVCLQCHKAAKFDQFSHHFHEIKSTGSNCVECHMPPRTYMVVDPRHDHSMRIPRPDLTEQLGTPNACNNCHTDKDPKWAAEQYRSWYPERSEGYQRYAVTLTDGHGGSPGAEHALSELIRDFDSPDIARATALSAMGPYLRWETINILKVGLNDKNPMLRAASLETSRQLPAEIRMQLIFPLLEDPVRAVRIQAAIALADIPAEQFTAKRQKLLDLAIAEYIEAQQASAERPEAQHNLGILYALQGQVARAVSAYETAIELDKTYIPGYVNLADLYRSQHDELRAEQILRLALKIRPDNADVHHALGLSLVRQQRTDEAVKELEVASLLAPNDERYIYVYAVALHSTLQTTRALMILQDAHDRFPGNINILNALTAFHSEIGNREKARFYAEKLQKISRRRE